MEEPDVVRPCARTWPPRPLDVALALLVAVGSTVAVVLGHPRDPGRALTVLDVISAVVVFGLLLVRRRWPIPVVAVVAGLAVAGIVTGGSAEAFVAATVVAVFTIATMTGRRTALLAGGLTALALYVAAVAGGSSWLGPDLGIVAWIGMATAFGDAARSRRAYVAAVEERARRAEQTREEEARRRVAEERIRIARDLHDVVAHHIAVINVHAGLAGHTLRTQPDKAETSLAHVRQAAQTVLDELATILSVLRQNGDPDAPTDPVRGLSQLGELLDSLAAAGLRVEHRQAGSAYALPAAADQAAFRIVQEALTNAHKHGIGATADLRIDYRPDTVVLDISNPSPATATPSERSGHGLTGMRERAVAVGGAVTAGPDGPGRFRVTAKIPVRPENEGAQ